MKNVFSGKFFIIVGLAVILIIVVGCVLGYFCVRKSEPFSNGCQMEYNFNDPNFKNQRFFHYNNIDRLVPSDPIHVPREIVDYELNGSDDSGSAKKKTQ